MLWVMFEGVLKVYIVDSIRRELQGQVAHVSKIAHRTALLCCIWMI